MDRLSSCRIPEDTVGNVREVCCTWREELQEYEAFGNVLQRRTTIAEDSSVPVLFRLYYLIMLPSTPNSPAVLHNGGQHLCLDCLRDLDD